MAKLRPLGFWLLLGVTSSACGATEEDGGGGASGGGATGGSATGGSGTDGSATGGGTTDSGSSGSGGQSASGGSSGSGGEPSSGGASPATGGDSSGGAGGSGGVPNDAVPTSGCDSDALPTGGLRTIIINGTTEREYILTLPENYDPSHPYRLIFGFHGGQYDAEWVANGEEPLTGPYFGLQAEAEGSAVFVAPQALPGSWSNTDNRDLDYVETMLNTIQGEVCIDASRIFSVGFSMGGIMTVRIGCALGNVFRAIAPMSPSLPADCVEDTEPIAYWTSHGASDTSITPEQGALARAEFLERNGCSEATTPTSPEGCVSHEGCSEGNPVDFCSFEGAHVPAPFAGPAIWAFFEQF